MISEMVVLTLKPELMLLFMFYLAFYVVYPIYGRYCIILYVTVYIVMSIMIDVLLSVLSLLLNAQLLIRY